jgi:hypothetical protein
MKRGDSVRWDKWTPVLTAILATQLRLDSKLATLQILMEKSLSTEAELQDDLDKISTAIVKVATLVTTQAATIADLQAQLKAGSPVTQQQLDSLKTQADGIVAALPPTP